MKGLNPIYYSINYDTGNSASLGYDINDEFNTYGNLIKTIHIKDRLLNGGPIILSKGNFKIKIFFKMLKKIRNLKFIIFQFYRDNNEITFKKQFNYFNKEFRRILS